MAQAAAGLTQAWEALHPILSREVPSERQAQWLRELQPLELSDGVMTIGAPNDFARDWFQQRYDDVVHRPFADTYGQPCRVAFVVNDGGEPVEKSEEHVYPTVYPPSPASSAVSSSGRGFHSLPLNPKNTFDSFVVGRSNQFTHAACVSTANAPAENFNPLFIYGDIGLGKTHLMQAIGHHLIERSPEANVVYVSGETFLYHVVSSIREDRTDAFRHFYRSVDLWLVDDVQYIAAERTQIEFFHVFNALYETNKQIVLCCDRPPKELTSLEARLRSRFEWGLITAINQPDFEHRVAILERKANFEQQDVPVDVIHYIAEKVKTNIRVLEGALTRVAAYASLTGHPITVALAEESLSDYTTESAAAPLTIERIQQAVAEYFSISVDDLVGKKRNKSIVEPRQLGMHLSRELTPSSLPEIGAAFGGRDHSTVIHSCDKMKTVVEEDTRLRTAYEALRSKLLST